MLFDLPRFVRGQGFEGLEISDRQIAGLGKDALQRFAGECQANRCGLIVDINVNFTSPDDRFLEEEIEHSKRMIRMASDLGVGIMRICLGGQAVTVQRIFRRGRGEARGNGEENSANDPLTGQSLAVQAETLVMRLGHIFRKNMSARIGGLESKLRRAVDSLRVIVPAAADRGIRIGIENHWGISGDPRNIIRIIEAVHSPYLGTCPDRGNFPRGVDPLAGLEALAPRAVILHAKSYGFRQDGEEKSIDYRSCLAVFRRNGFDGPVTVEYEGLGDDIKGCRLTREIILRHW
jgi:sugar phosphate isomerase/epimerase